MTDQELINKGYYGRKSGGGSSYNYELAPLIQDFSFYDFIAGCEPDCDHGGFLVITDKQYIIGYNAGFGVGGHMSSYARVMKDLQGGGDIQYRDAVRLNTECCMSYVTARITYENIEGGHEGYIHFTLTNHPITEKQFEVF